jgi:ATP-dependent Clp protease ATP-binding subunit ClpA
MRPATRARRRRSRLLAVARYAFPTFVQADEPLVVSAVTREVSTSEQRLCRLAQEAADARDPLSALETLAELRRELQAVTREQVTRGLSAGRSFGEVGRALGVSRQAAHRRYRELVPAQAPRVRATEELRRVLRVAREEALSSNATALGSEHLLIAVLRCGDEAARALVREGVTLEAARAAARRLAADRGGPSGFGASRPGVHGVLRDATQAALARGDRWLDVGAVLLAALAESQGGARRVLIALGVDVATVRARLECERDARYPPAGTGAANGNRSSDAA